MKRYVRGRVVSRRRVRAAVDAAKADLATMRLRLAERDQRLRWAEHQIDDMAADDWAIVLGALEAAAAENARLTTILQMAIPLVEPNLDAGWGDMGSGCNFCAKAFDWERDTTFHAENCPGISWLALAKTAFADTGAEALDALVDAKAENARLLDALAGAQHQTEEDGRRRAVEADADLERITKLEAENARLAAALEAAKAAIRTVELSHYVTCPTMWGEPCQCRLGTWLALPAVIAALGELKENDDATT